MARGKEKNFYRLCPDCKIEIWYKTKISFKRADVKKTLCDFCSRKGLKNGFFGKTHSSETINNLKNKDLSYMQTDSYQEKYRASLPDRKTNTKSNFDCWVEKYGLEEANKKLESSSKKKSIASSGANNPMFGKPSPQGSGNGWSGWYNKWRFRSILELSFMINYIEKNNLKWESAEKKKFMIPYFDNKGVSRNYYPDFYLPENRQLIECKPVKLFNTVIVKQKKEVAEKFCTANEMEYVLTDIERLTDGEMKMLYLSGKIKFIDKYDEKWRKRFL